MSYNVKLLIEAPNIQLRPPGFY